MAKDLAPVVAGILSGEVKASAAQVALIKDVQNRAFGKPAASVAEKAVAAGVIILPALDTGMKMMLCPKCGFDATKTLVETESGSTNSVSE